MLKTTLILLNWIILYLYWHPEDLASTFSVPNFWSLSNNCLITGPFIQLSCINSLWVHHIQKLSRLGDSIISKWTDKQTLLTSNLQGQLAGRIKNKCSLPLPLVRKSTLQQIRLNSAKHVWISIKEEGADTFDPIIGRLWVGYPKISSCIQNLFKLRTNLVEFYPAIQKETAKPENAHSLGPMQGGSKKTKNGNAPAHPQIWLDSVWLFAQSVTCLATDVSLNADPGVARFDPDSVPYFFGDCLRSFSSLPLNHSRRVVVSYKRKYVNEVLVNCLLKLAQEKVWLGELTVPPWP